MGSFQTTTKASNLCTIGPDGTGLAQVTHFGDNDTRATQPFIDADGTNLTVLDGPSATHPRLRPVP